MVASTSEPMLLDDAEISPPPSFPAPTQARSMVHTQSLGSAIEGIISQYVAEASDEIRFSLGPFRFVARQELDRVHIVLDENDMLDSDDDEEPQLDFNAPD